MRRLTWILKVCVWASRWESHRRMEIIALEIWLVVLTLMPKYGQAHIGDAPEAEEKNRAEELHLQISFALSKFGAIISHTIVL